MRKSIAIALIFVMLFQSISILPPSYFSWIQVPNLSWLFPNEVVAQSFPSNVTTSTQANALNYPILGRVYHVAGYYWVFASTASSSISYFSSSDGFTWSAASTLISLSPLWVSTSVDTKNNYLLLCSVASSGSTITWANWSFGAGTITKYSTATKTFTMTGTSLGGGVTYCSTAMATNSTMYVAILSNSTDKFVHVEVWKNPSPETTSNVWSKVDDVNTTSKTTTSTGVFITPLASGNVAVFYSQGSNLCGFSFNATSGVWSSATCIANSLPSSLPDALAAIGNTVYYVPANKIIPYTLGTGWGTASSLPSGLPSCPCSVSTDNKTNIFVFASNGSNVVFEQSTNGGSSFGSAQTLVSGLTSVTNLDTEAYTQDGVIPLVWRAGSASPYTIQFAATSIVQVTVPIKLTLNQPGYTPATFSISGCAVSPNTVVGDGIVHNVVANGLCTITITAPANQTLSGYHFTTQTIFTCGTGTCPTSSFNYDRLFKVNVGAFPAAWGSVNTSSQWYVANSAFGILATPASPAYKFLGWYSTNGTLPLSSYTSTSTRATVIAGGTLYALFNITQAYYSPNIFNLKVISTLYAYSSWAGSGWGFAGSAGSVQSDSNIQEYYIATGQVVLPTTGYANWCYDSNISTSTYIQYEYSFQASNPGNWLSPQMSSDYVKYRAPFQIQVPLDGYGTECPQWAADITTKYPDLITADYNGTVYTPSTLTSSHKDAVRFDSLNFSVQVYNDLINLYNNLMKSNGGLIALWHGLYISSEGADHGDVKKPGATFTVVSQGTHLTPATLSYLEFSNATLLHFFQSPQCVNYNTTLTCASMAQAILNKQYSTPQLANYVTSFFAGWGANNDKGFGAFLDKEYFLSLTYAMYNFTKNYPVPKSFVLRTSYVYSPQFMSNTTYPAPFNTSTIESLDLLNRFIEFGRLTSTNGNPPTQSMVNTDLANCAGSPLGSAANGVTQSTFITTLGGSPYTNLLLAMQNNPYYTPACLGSIVSPSIGGSYGNTTPGSVYMIMYTYGQLLNRLYNVGEYVYPDPLINGATNPSTTITVAGGYGEPILLWFYTNSSAPDTAKVQIRPFSFGISGSWIAISLLNLSVIAKGAPGTIANISVTVPAKSWQPVYIIQTQPYQSLLYTNMPLLSIQTGANSEYTFGGPHTFSAWAILNESSAPIQVTANNSASPLTQYSSLSSLNKTWVGYYWNASSSTWQNLTQYGWYYDSANHLLYVHFQIGSPTQLSVQTGSLTSTTTSVSCNPTTIAVGSSTACTATVTGSSPTGSVSWSGSGLSLNPTSCTLSSGSCSTTATATAVGSLTITATYSGDANNAGSSGSTTITVNKASSTTSLSCSPSSVSVSQSTTCTATVTGYNPTGTVSFSSSSSGGAFTPTSCTLSSGSCAVSYSDSIAGSPTITATYSGDANNAGSSGSTTITVTSPPSGGGSGGGGGGGGGGGIVQICPPGQTLNYTSGQCSSPTLSTIQNNSKTQNNTLILLVIFVLLAFAYMNRKKLRKYVR
jgi:hypothetical protein